MARTFIVRQLSVTLLTTLIATPLLRAFPPQISNVETIEARVRQLHATSAPVQVKVGERTLRGSIEPLDVDSFTLRQKNSTQEVTVPYAQVIQIKKNGRGAKVLIIPAIIVGGAVLALCAAPYPIGFLCRRDPS